MDKEPSEAGKKELLDIEAKRPYDITHYASSRGEFVEVLAELAAEASASEAVLLSKFVQDWATAFSTLPEPLKESEAESFRTEKKLLLRTIGEIGKILSQRSMSSTDFAQHLLSEG